MQEIKENGEILAQKLQPFLDDLFLALSDEWGVKVDPKEDPKPLLKKLETLTKMSGGTLYTVTKGRRPSADVQRKADRSKR